MPSLVAYSLENFPEQHALLGDMILGYADLEYLVIDLVGQAMGGDLDTAVRMLYRLRGAHDRLNLADAVLRPFLNELNLAGPYGQWLGAMRRCRIIRNQYAHCGWRSKDGKLWFASLDEAGQSSEGATAISFVPLELELLKEQQAYFWYTAKLTFYLMDEARFRRDRRRRHKSALPKSRAVPKLHSPLD